MKNSNIYLDFMTQILKNGINADDYIRHNLTGEKLNEQFSSSVSDQ